MVVQVSGVLLSTSLLPSCYNAHHHYRCLYDPFTTPARHYYLDLNSPDTLEGIEECESGGEARVSSSWCRVAQKVLRELHVVRGYRLTERSGTRHGDHTGSKGCG
jgi:type VI protein secretion system component VasA